MGKKILILTGDAGESFEVLYAMHRFQEANYEVTIAAPNKKRLNLVIHDFEPGWDTYIERQGYWRDADIAFKDVHPDDYDYLLIPGGRAPEYIRNDQHVISIVQQFHQAGKFIFAICHGIQLLVTAGLVNQKNITCYEHVKFEVESCGGIFNGKDQAIRDGKLVTGQTWQSHPEFYRLVFECLAEDAN